MKIKEPCGFQRLIKTAEAWGSLPLTKQIWSGEGERSDSAVFRFVRLQWLLPRLHRERFIFTIACRYPRWGAVYPTTFLALLMLGAECPLGAKHEHWGCIRLENRSPSGILPLEVVNCVIGSTRDGHTGPVGVNHVVSKPALLGFFRDIRRSYP